ncbi:nucleoside hydrolase [Candidatus Latescibacterota bacterium]
MNSKCLFCFVMILSLFSFVFMAHGQEKIKIIFDTDIAGDIDDAFAHGLVQVSDEFEVLGITIADGPTRERAIVSCRMLYECNQEHIPVAFGRPTRQGSGLAPQLIWGEGFDKYKPVKESAADFIIRNLRKYPGEITIISVGPVTNLGDVIDKDPEAWKMVKAVYSMFGSFYMGYDEGPIPSAEWNVRADVKSSQKFMTSGVPIVLAGLDVTTMVKFREERRLQLLFRRSPLTDAICSLYSLWSADSPGRHPTLFDPVAVAMVINPRVVGTRDAYVRVTDEGYTVIEESREPNCKIGMSVNVEGVLDFVTERLLKQNLMR